MEYQKKYSENKKDKNSFNKRNTDKKTSDKKISDKKASDKILVDKNGNRKVEYKSKFSKFKTKQEVKDNKSKIVKETVITDYFYMSPNQITAKMMDERIQVQDGIQVDLWEEMNILQIEFPNKLTVDFEPMSNEFKDSSDAAFIKNRNIKTVFAVTIDAGAFPLVKPLLKKIITEFDGFLCADSVDFKPLYALNDL
jgi:hypothetical protein